MRLKNKSHVQSRYIEIEKYWYTFIIPKLSKINNASIFDESITENYFSSSHKAIFCMNLSYPIMLQITY